MKKKILIIFLFLIMFSIFNGYKYNNENIKNDMEINNDDRMLSMMLETEAGSGKYKETTASEWPTDGYIFNENLSKCENGGILTWDDENKKVIMSGNTSDKCYVYFDVRVITLADYCSNGDNLSSCIKILGNQGSEVSNIYIHNSNLTNGANDGSYRYAGSSETTNNFVCFGYDSTDGTCPTDYLYRIIGVFDNQVKLIKYDYATSSLLGTDGSCFANSISHSDLYKGELTDLSNCNWDYFGSDYFGDMYPKNLNTNLLNNIGSKWSNKIATYTWKMKYDFGFGTPSATYSDEITSEASDATYDAKIGLMYPSEYGFAAAPSAWTLALREYKSVTSDNWIYMGLGEYIMGINGDAHFELLAEGKIIGVSVVAAGMAIRPTFYLNSDVLYSQGTGTFNDPIRIE